MYLAIGAKRLVVPERTPLAALPHILGKLGTLGAQFTLFALVLAAAIHRDHQLHDFEIFLLFHTRLAE